MTITAKRLAMRVAAPTAVLLGAAGLAVFAVPAQHASAAPSCVTGGGTTTCTFSVGQTWSIPSGVHAVHIVATGGAGGGGEDNGANSGGAGGLGGIVSGSFSVAHGQFLTVIVGQAGDPGSLGGAGGSGYGDGGDGATATGFNGGGGGGSSAVISSATGLLLAGPGGGGGGGAGTGCVATAGGGGDGSSTTVAAAGETGATCAGGAGGPGGSGELGTPDGGNGTAASGATGGDGGGGGGGDGGGTGGSGATAPGQGGGASGGITSDTVSGHGGAGLDGSVVISFATPGPAPGALSITTSSPLPNGTRNHAYSTTLHATGGTPGYTWSLVSGSLPTGLSLSSGGVISGTPTSNGTRTFTVQVRDSAGATASKQFSLTVSGTPSDLSILLSHNGFLRHNRTATYVMDIANTNGTATSVEVHATLQVPGSIWIRQGGAGTFWQCHKKDHSTFCARNAKINGHSSTTITVKVMVRAARGKLITAKATVSPSDSTPGDNTDADTAIVRKHRK